MYCIKSLFIAGARSRLLSTSLLASYSHSKSCMAVLFGTPKSFFHKTGTDFKTSELKRRMKAEKKAKEKAEKVASQAPAGAEKEKSKREQEEEIDPNEYLKLRTQHVTKLKEAGKNPYPHKFDVQMSLEEFIKRFEKIENGTILDQEIKVAGRVHAMRPSGAKLNFYDLRGEGVKIQIMANAKYYISEEEYRLMDERLRRGDMVGVRGKPGKTKTGELSIVPTEITVLSPCLHQLPHMYYGLKDKGWSSL